MGGNHKRIVKKKFRMVFGPCIPAGFGREDITPQSKEFARELVKDVKARVDKRVGTLAHDGWKNLDVKKVNTAMLTGPDYL